MSQMTATARPLRAPVRRPAPVVPLRALPNRLATSGGRAFAMICVTLLGTGLIAVLVLNTVLAQGALELDTLQKQNAELRDTANSLQEEVSRASSAGALAKRAADMGMVRQGERGFIDLRTGTVTGEAVPATGAQKLSIVLGPSNFAVVDGTAPDATPSGTHKPTSTAAALTLGGQASAVATGTGTVLRPEFGEGR